MINSDSLRVRARDGRRRLPRSFGAAASPGGAALALCLHVLDTSDLVKSRAKAAADVTQTALESLGFDHVGDSKTPPWRVLVHSHFLRFFLGSIISNWGTWLQNTAQMLLAYRFTHSVFTVALVT